MAHPLDPLALPPVPPPAPATHPLRDAIVATLFGAALALTGLAALKTPVQTTLELENRSIAAWPRFAPSPTFTADFERAFGDRFGGRIALFRLHHVALVELFGVSPVANVLLGRDDWLYFLGEDATSLDRHFRGTLATAEAEIDAVTAEFRRRERFLASLKIPYVITIVPEKFTIYPEHLPSWAVRSAAPTPLDRLATALLAEPGLRFVDLRASLRAGKPGRYGPVFPGCHDRFYRLDTGCIRHSVKRDHHLDRPGCGVSSESLLPGESDVDPQLAGGR